MRSVSRAAGTSRMMPTASATLELNQLRQLLPCLSPARVKLGITLAMVGQSGNSRTDPLAHVPGKMQHQIADRVLVVGIPRPDLFRRQPRQAILNAAVQLFQFVG